MLPILLRCVAARNVPFCQFVWRQTLCVALVFVLAHAAAPGASAVEPVLRINSVGASTIVFSPDGRYLATAHPDVDGIHVWDATTGKRVGVLKSKPLVELPGVWQQGIYGLDWSGTARLIATGGMEGVVRLWDPRNYREIAALHRGRYCIRALRFTPDGKRLVSGTQDGKLIISDVDSKQTAATYTPQGGKYILDLAVSPDGKLAAVSGIGEIRLHDIASARLLRTFPVEARASPRLCFSTDGATVYALIQNWKNPAIRAWDIKTGRDKTLVKLKDMPAWAFAISTDGQWLAYASPERVVTLLHTKAPQRRITLTGHGARVVALAFSSKQQLASSQGSISIWDLSAVLKQADQLPTIKLPTIKE